ncbi:methyl-accepting chemotaxis protein [Pseudomonas sp. Marseille-QA0892]
MLLFLSWKQKFRLLIVITLLGLALMAASALWANRNLGSAMEAQQRATDYDRLTTTLLNEWLKTETMRGYLDASTIEAYRNRLNSLPQQASALVEQARPLGDADLESRAKAIEAAVKENARIQAEWLDLNQRFGLDQTSGERKTAAEIAAPLEAISIALIQPFITTALASQRDYFTSLDGRYAEKARKAIADLRSKLIELDWMDSQIGENTETFAANFDRADAIISQIVADEKQLEAQGQQLSGLVSAQQQALRNGILAKTLAQAEQTRQSAYWILGIAFILIAAFLIIAIGQASSRLMKQLTTVIQQLSRVANGDLRVNVEVGRNPRDEFNQLGQGTNGMTRGISSLIGQVLDGNRELTRLHGYLSDAMQRLDSNSSHLESQTEQAASASHQIAATVNEMARRASDVGDATQHAHDSARTGASVIMANTESIRALSRLIQTTHAQVNELIQSSGRVSGIVDVINSLADQTNLLALNAAIEAARAGEAGRGFSVVADEVRSLAQKTVSATTDIGRIIDELKQQTGSMDSLMSEGVRLSTEGERQAGQAAEAINVITQSMDRLSEEMTQVVVAIEEISATTEDIAGKMEEINHSNRETRDLRLALDEHTRGLSARVDALNQTTGRFQIA